MRNRVLVIGMDGATPELLFPWAEEGKLPNLAKLIEKGVSGKLRSTIPPITAAAWVSFMTGKSPGKHGVVDFVQRKFGSYEITRFDRSEIEEKFGIDLSVVNAATINSKKIWDILSDNGKRVGVMHVPITYPPKKVNGFMITGLGTPSPESNFTYPRKLKEKIISEGYKIHITELDVEGNEEAALQDLRETEEKRCTVAINLMREYDNWDFFFVMFEATDFVQHFFWKHTDPEHHAHEPEKAKKYGDAILNCYQLLDEQIGKILGDVDEEDDTAVIIMSDHGGGPLNKIFYINRWLLDMGLIKLKEAHSKRMALNLGLDRENIRYLLTKLGLKKFIKIIPKNIRERIPDAYTIADFDWNGTRAYSIGGWGFVYLNLIGREPEGIVSEEEYESLRNYIIEELYKLKDQETGENIVKEVFKKEDLYGGQPLDQLPDLIVMPDESTDFKHSIPKTKETARSASLVKLSLKGLLVPSSPEKSGNHRKDGIFIIKGRNIKKNMIIENAEIIDIAPTILYLMEVPIPSDMDGKVITDAFNPKKGRIYKI